MTEEYYEALFLLKKAENKLRTFDTDYSDQIGDIIASIETIYG